MTVLKENATLGDLVTAAASEVLAMRRTDAAVDLMTAAGSFQLAPGEVTWAASADESDDLVALAAALNTPQNPVFIDWYAASRVLRATHGR
ncbi:hypothetical protein GTW37_38690 [Streptomyces sp. SID4931]|nr:hypothetical protein [Streptomyces sp. SID4931]SCG10026.1 hypothetical protein GA0115255_126605 [Streptomyces sp. Ncost-T6T-2b]